MSVIEMKRDIFCVIMVHSLGGSAERAAPGLEKAVRASPPDLVILNGDIVCGISDPDEFASAASLIAKAAGATGAKFAVTFGDRDDKNGLSRADQLAVYRSLGCLTEAGEDDIDGVGNCVIGVKKDGKTVLCVRLFDSHSETTAYEREYGSPSRSRLPYPLYSHYYMDGVRFNQTMWLRRTCDTEIPELLFFHIPTPEHAQLPLNASQVGFDGVQCEEVRCQTVNGGLSMTAADLGNILGIFCGNDEKNDFFGHWGGMTLGVAPSFAETGTAHVIEFSRNDGKPCIRVSRITA